MIPLYIPLAVPLICFILYALDWHFREQMTPLYIALVVASLCFLLYAIDRRMKSKPIELMSASKLSLLGGLLSGGIAYTISSPEVFTEDATGLIANITPTAVCAILLFSGLVINL